jgi:hypothetical protein
MKWRQKGRQADTHLFLPFLAWMSDWPSILAAITPAGTVTAPSSSESSGSGSHGSAYEEVMKRKHVKEAKDGCL